MTIEALCDCRKIPTTLDPFCRSLKLKITELPWLIASFGRIVRAAVQEEEIEEKYRCHQIQFHGFNQDCEKGLPPVG